MLKVVKQTNGSPEIFFSIQGEGVNLGRPSVFLRLANCNLACVWCDTKYAWDWSAYNPREQVIEMSADAVAQEILKYHCRNIVITGGEPLLQQRELLPLVTHLKVQGSFIEVETNCTILPTAALAELIDHWSVSPKLESSGNAPSAREKPDCFAAFVPLQSHFKFVVQDDHDLAEIQALAAKYGLSPERIILMPQAQNVEELIAKSRTIVEHCKTHGYLFSTRLQVLLWGNRWGI